MAQFRFYPRDKNADSTSIQLIIRDGAQGKRSLKLGTGIVISNPERNWDGVKYRVKSSYRLAQPINLRLSEIQNEAERLYMHAYSVLSIDAIEYVREEMPKSGLLASSNKSASTLDDNGVQLGLEVLLKTFKDAREPEFEKATIKTYETTRAHVEEFDRKQRAVTLANDITLDWVDKFRSFLRKRGMADNTVRRNLKILKTCLKWADDRALINNTSYIKAIRLGNEKQTIQIALTLEEVDRIEALDLEKKPGLKRARNAFLVQCYTGLRFSDLERVSVSQIKDGFLTIQPKKTKDHLVRLPISPRLMVVLKKFDATGIPLISAQQYNKHIKDLGRLADITDTVQISEHRGNKRVDTEMPKYMAMSSHTGRRSFITILLREGHPQALVMKLSGHKDVRSFMTYALMTDDDASEAIASTFS